MMGKIYETPSTMTEKASHDINGGRQPSRTEPASTDKDETR